ncbi:nonribosomal peptide synthetase [Fusarium albosuccineum]|uniref:Nonribosomal peptide synthetase n=1 Tax=Fusarium albosuccineum TaxID=1237068 RepID=A0A8H4LEX8_9HYPO|nr:nonribosomal peptide synthetase [Fusarium albosuccineum]
MATVNQTYFTCTLGEAARLKCQAGDSMPSCQTVMELIVQQAWDNPQSPALGFATFKNKASMTESPHPVLSFQDLFRLSGCAAQTLSDHLVPTNKTNPATTVGLLCTSSVDFVLTWLGLMRLGYSALLLAPQLEPPAIQHLCKTLQVNDIIVDEIHHHKLDNIRGDINIFRVPRYQDHAPSAVSTVPRPSCKVPEVAYYCHTSGTSSGLPKPIPQTQFGVAGALPRFPKDGQPATFSTTPLYHGGFPDCLRAWTSGAMIWFFPEGHAPITGANILKAITYARAKSSVPAKYFSSVPYILQMLAEEDGGIQVLQSMDLVGVGGAALPPAVGDKLVNSGINLVSRMGSAECGFLMSSHRDYEKDKDWQYLRVLNDLKLLSFEPQENGLSELVAKPGWPFKVKTNRDDGSYATSDLFEPHPSKPNAWRYHSRADAQITLANGKKFDPSPMEGSILASTTLLQDVLIFGSGKDYSGALLFLSSSETSETELIDAVWPHIQHMNTESQGHARITKTMLVVIPKQGEKPLEKSSKGTILRRQAEERYTHEIESAYQGKGSSGLDFKQISDEELQTAVLDFFSQVLGRAVEPDQDLYRQGVDSIACIQVRKLIETNFLPQSTVRLPMNIIYDQGTVTALVEYLRRIRKGETPWDGHEGDDQLTSMRQLAQNYSTFGGMKPVSQVKQGDVVVLTGATGFLGSHILHLLQNDPKIRKVFCLLRAESSRAAYERVSKALIQRNMPGLEQFNDAEWDQRKVICLPCDLSSDDLGLSGEHRRHVFNEGATIIHSAWAVNFSLRLNSFEDQIAGTRNLINLAAETRSRFIFASSTAAVISSPSTPIPEKIYEDPTDASPMGYSQSKWVAEQVCDAANKHLMDANSTDHLTTIIRIGQLCSNDAGIWNASEAYPLLLSTAKVVGCLPDIPDEVVNWLPVEAAAQSVLEIAFPNRAKAPETTNGKETPEERTRTSVYHVLNPHVTPTWSQMLQWISKNNEERPFEIISARDWVRRLEDALGKRKDNHPSQALLEMWKERFYGEVDGESRATDVAQLPVFDLTETQHASSAIRNVQPLDCERMVKTWRWVNDTISG